MKKFNGLNLKVNVNDDVTEKIDYVKINHNDIRNRDIDIIIHINHETVTYTVDLLGTVNSDDSIKYSSERIYNEWGHLADATDTLGSWDYIEKLIPYIGSLIDHQADMHHGLK